MNILVDTLPESLVVMGKPYRINSDFRACLKSILAFEDNTITPQEKQLVLLDNLYITPPGNMAQALERAVWFMNGGIEPDRDLAETDPVRVYSFTKDAGFIFAAFRQTHGIDLQKDDLHWWEFLALFMDLGSETSFCQLIGLRRRLKTGKASKEERAAAREMGGLVEVPEFDTRTLHEKEVEAEFMRMVE